MDNNLDLGSSIKISNHINKRLVTIIWGKMLKFFVADPDPGSGAFLILDPGRKNSYPGSGSVCLFNSSGVFVY
jgi:hypothetical protein